MTAAQTIRTIVTASPSWTQNKLGAEVGLMPQAMSSRMHASDMKAGFLATCLDALGYRLVAVPKGTRLPSGSIVVDGTEEGE